MSITLWVDKYAPRTMDDYVWRDPAMRAKFEEYISEGALPHLLLSGRAGAGKTSLAKLLMHILGVPESDILFVKASNERKIDEVQSRIMNFVQSYPMFDNEHGMKYVILDEADALSILSQRFLRSEMEDFSSTTRFILTCNYPQKLDAAIHSRCHQYHFEALSMEQFITRMISVLNEEGVAFESKDVVDYIQVTYPDLRKCIGTLQLNTLSGKLQPMPVETCAALDWMNDAANLFRAGKIDQGRKLIVDQATTADYNDIFRWMYQNIGLWGDDQDKQDDALIIIRDGLYKHAFMADPEINLSATMAQLAMLRRPN